MSTGLIIAIVVIAIILIALFAFVLPRARHKAQLRSREKELEQRRERVAGEHRAEADERARHAERAEQKARMAEQEAKRERAEAELHQERAATHERGMADDELVEDHERERFAETSAMRPDKGDDTPDRGDTTAGSDTAAEAAPRRSEDPDYVRGRQDERHEQEGRFARDPQEDQPPARRGY